MKLSQWRRHAAEMADVFPEFLQGSWAPARDWLEPRWRCALGGAPLGARIERHVCSNDFTGCMYTKYSLGDIFTTYTVSLIIDLSIGTCKQRKFTSPLMPPVPLTPSWLLTHTCVIREGFIPGATYVCCNVCAGSTWAPSTETSSILKIRTWGNQMPITWWLW